jgi:hypothetical protein
MINIWDQPLLIFGISLLGLWLSAFAGVLCRKMWRPLRDVERDEFNVAQAASLTLLSLIIGFSFSMAVSRYDQRKNLEEEEANAIGTEFVRADLLPDASAARTRELLKLYLDQRILFYETRDEGRLAQIDAETAKMQADLWSAVRSAVTAQPTPATALAASGMNDVLNSQGYTQAAWWNRIPASAWRLMAAIAVACNLLIGYGARRAGAVLFLIVPLTVSISFLLIADIDSPRGGVIRVVPQNLDSLAQSLAAR